MPFLRLFFIVFSAFFALEKAASQTPDSAVSSQKWRRGAAVLPDSLPPKIEANQPDSAVFSIKNVEKDSILPKKGPLAPVVGFFKKGYPNPRKALLFSALVPGGGQLYNQKYWKAPLAWAAIGTAGWFMIKTRRTYLKYQRNYLALVDGDTATAVEMLPINSKPDAPLFSDLDKTSLKQGRDYFRTWTERSYLFLLGAYVLSATDAFVDAHLATFDVSDDLSLRVRPTQIPTVRGPDALGIGLTFSIKPKADNRFISR